MFDEQEYTFTKFQLITGIIITVSLFLSLALFTTQSTGNQRNQVTEKPTWLDNVNLDTIIDEASGIFVDVVNIPNNHYKDVRENHHYNGFLPTIDSQGNKVQKTPCVKANLIYPDGTTKLTCIRY